MFSSGDLSVQAWRVFSDRSYTIEFIQEVNNHTALRQVSWWRNHTESLWSMKYTCANYFWRVITDTSREVGKAWSGERSKQTVRLGKNYAPATSRPKREWKFYRRQNDIPMSRSSFGKHPHFLLAYFLTSSFITSMRKQISFRRKLRSTEDHEKENINGDDKRRISATNRATASPTW